MCGSLLAEKCGNGDGVAAYNLGKRENEQAAAESMFEMGSRMVVSDTSWGAAQSTNKEGLVRRYLEAKIDGAGSVYSRSTVVEHVDENCGLGSLSGCARSRE